MIGSGYVGLVSGACLADFGHRVTCVDHDESKIKKLMDGKIPIFEPGLEDLVRKNVQLNRLRFSTDVRQHVSDAKVVFVAVGTPSRRGDGHADLSFVYEATREITPHADDYSVIAVKSTVPVGTGDEIERIVREMRPNSNIAVVSNPEFLREGAAITDFKHPDRIVVGSSNDPRAEDVMSAVYRPLYLNQAPLLFTTRRTAELIKYAANAFLAMKITYINEMADLCEKVGADVGEVARGMGLDNRIGLKFLHAGPGYGGSCFPKDTMALAKIAQDHDSPVRLVETTIAINDQRKRAMGRKVLKALGGRAQGRTIAVLGLTFKPNTDDMREAPSLYILQTLLDAGAKIRAYDPAGMDAAREVMADIEYGNDPYDIAAGADALVIITEWPEFRALDLRRLKELLTTPILVDLRNIYARKEVEKLGFTYVAVGH